MKIKNLIFAAGALLVISGATIPATEVHSADTNINAQESQENPETLDATPIFLLSLVASLGLAGFCVLQGLKSRR